MSGSDFKPHNEEALTRAQYDALMVGRTRPLTDRFMSNAHATQARDLAPTRYDPTDNIIDMIERVGAKAALATMNARLSVHSAITGRRGGGCGTDAGYHAHRRYREDACAECREAHRVATAVSASRINRPSRAKKAS